MRFIGLVLLMAMASSTCFAQGSMEILGQTLPQRIEKFKNKMDKFFEGESIDEKLLRWYNSALSSLSNKKEAKVATAEDGFVYVRSRGNVVTSNFDERKDLLCVTPSDWEKCDYRKGKSVYSKHYYKHFFAQNRQSKPKRLGMDIYGYSRKAKHLGEVDFSNKGAQLKKILSEYNGAEFSSEVCGKSVKEFIKKDIRDSDEQAALVKVKYQEKSQDRFQWLLAFKTEDCYIKQVGAKGDELISAKAVYLADLDPHLGKTKVFRLFYLPVQDEFAFEYTYIKSHSAAHNASGKNILQSKRYLHSAMLCACKMSPVRSVK